MAVKDDRGDLDLDSLDMRAVRDGEWERFAQIVGRNQSKLFRYAASRLGCRSLAEDAVQQSFLAAFKGRNSFDPRRGFRAWLWTIHVNECGQLARARIRNRLSESAFLSGGIGHNEAEAPEAALDRQEQRQYLAELLATLPEEQGEAVRLRYFGELSFEEIAQATGVRPATAKSRVRYGLSKLAGCIRSRQEIVP